MYKSPLLPQILYPSLSPLIVLLDTLLNDRFTSHHRIEAVVLIGGIVDGAMQTIRVEQTVRSLHVVAVPLLVLLLNVAGVRVVHRVRERVLCGRIVFVRAHDVLYNGQTHMMRLENVGHVDGYLLYVLLLAELLLLLQMLGVGNNSKKDEGEHVL